MKRFLFSLLSLCSILHARDFQDQTMQWNLGPLFNYARYNLDCLPKIQGYLVGIHTDFAYNQGPGIYTQLQFDGRWNAGFIAGDFDIKTKIRDFRPEWFLGYSFAISRNEHTRFMPLLGFGFYHLSNELQPDVMTYRYFNIYIPVGFETIWLAHEDEFEISLRALYRPDVYTKLKLSTPCIEPCECTKIDLERSHGFHIEMPFTWYKSWHRSANFQIKVVPFFDWNRFGAANESNENDLCVEIPRLDRWYLGTRLDFGIRF